MTKVYVINLDRSKERLSRITDRLAQVRLTFERITAVDGRSLADPNLLGYDYFKNRFHYGRKLTNGEIGCYASHLNALRTFLMSEENYCLILEDDAVLDNNLDLELISLIQKINSIDFYCVNCSNIAQHTVPARPNIKPDQNIHQALVFPTLATGLLWSRKGAEYFINEFSTISKPFDQALRDWLSSNGKGLSLNKALIKSENLESDIGSGVRRSEQSKIEGFMYDIVRGKRDAKLAIYFMKNWILSKFNS